MTTKNNQTASRIFRAAELRNRNCLVLPSTSQAREPGASGNGFGGDTVSKVLRDYQAREGLPAPVATEQCGELSVFRFRHTRDRHGCHAATSHACFCQIARTLFSDDAMSGTDVFAKDADMRVL